MQVALILNNPELFAEWKQDIQTMAGRIIEMRKQLYKLLTEELKTPGNWDHIINQIGMFRWAAISCLVCNAAAGIARDRMGRKLVFCRRAAWQLPAHGRTFAS